MNREQRRADKSKKRGTRQKQMRGHMNGGGNMNTSRNDQGVLAEKPIPIPTKKEG